MNKTANKIKPEILTKSYCSNIIYTSTPLSVGEGLGVRYLTENGYIENDMYYYFVKDYLGNNRLVLDEEAMIVQQNNYYPFGMNQIYSAEQQDDIPYKFSGKELESGGGLNWYDFSARCYDAARGNFGQIDPMCEKYYEWSPYLYCGANPVNRTDPTGMDWFYYARDAESEPEWIWRDEKEYHTGVFNSNGVEVILKGFESVVVFEGAFDEKLGSDGTLTGEGANPANVTVYGPNGSDDVKTYRGLSISSDPSKYPTLANGTYSAKHQQMATSTYGQDAKTYKITGATTETAGYPISVMWFESANLSPVSGWNSNKKTNYMTDIFLHRTNWNGIATKSSQGCLLIDGQQYKEFQKQLGTPSSFLLIINRKYIDFDTRSSKTGIMAN